MLVGSREPTPPIWSGPQYLPTSSRYRLAVPAPRLHCGFLTGLHIRPFPGERMFGPLEFGECHGDGMKPISCNQETRDTERPLCPGDTQGPAWFHYHGMTDSLEPGRIREDVSLTPSRFWLARYGRENFAGEREEMLIAPELIPKWPENLLRSFQWKFINSYYTILTYFKFPNT